MRLLLSSVLLGLAWFSAINVLCSLLVWGAAAVMARRSTPFTSRTLFITRLVPAAVSSLFVLAIFLPAHWSFEPADTDESFGIVLAVIAVLGAMLLARSVLRAIAVALATRRLSALTRLSSSRLDGGAIEIGGLPGVSLAGILRPQILIGSDALAALSPDELDVAISHEIAHRRSGDNLKRFLMYCAPDLLGWFGAAQWLEDRWQAESECEADASAVGGEETRAVVLASALVKVAQLTGTSTPALQSAAWSAFHVPTLLETRVRRLVNGNLAVPVNRGRAWIAAAALACAVPTAVWLFDLSHSLHQATEVLVMHLP